MLPTEFQDNGSFGSGEEAKNRFSRWPSWIFDPVDFSCLLSTSYLMLPTKFQVNYPFGLGEEDIYFSRWPPWRLSSIFCLNDFSYF